MLLFVFIHSLSLSHRSIGVGKIFMFIFHRRTREARAVRRAKIWGGWTTKTCAPTQLLGVLRTLWVFRFESKKKFPCFSFSLALPYRRSFSLFLLLFFPIQLRQHESSKGSAQRELTKQKRRNLFTLGGKIAVYFLSAVFLPISFVFVDVIVFDGEKLYHFHL